MAINLKMGGTPNPSLPLIRQDLEIHNGPMEEDGSPSYSLFDAVNAKFYKMSWGEMELIKHLKEGMTAQDLVNTLNQKSTLRVSVEEVNVFFEEAKKNKLLRTPPSTKELIEESHAMKKKMRSPINLIGQFAFMSIPLINPDKFLTKTVKYVRFLGSPAFLTIYLLSAILGMFLLLTRFDQFIHTFPYFFNLQGIVAFFCCVSLIKVIHEFGHAYTAKAYGVRVPQMGIMLMLFMPMLFTNVTDSWKLSDRRQRIHIAAAGVIVEVFIAALSTLGWALSTPGIFQSICFLLASSSWIGTLLVNINPAMKFDGYYLLMDFWKIDNLQTRAFEVTKWSIRRFFLGIEAPCPEEGISIRRIVSFISYSLYCWTYRLILFTGISVAVFVRFAKIVGVMLFIMSITRTLISPIVKEIKAWIMMKPLIKSKKRMRLSAIALACLGAFFIIPLPHTEKFPAIISPIAEQRIYAPSSGVIQKVFVSRDQMIEKNTPILEISSLDNDYEILDNQAEMRLLKAQINTLKEDDKNTPLLGAKYASLAEAEQKLKTSQEIKKQNTLTSQITGQLHNWNPDMKEGVCVKKDAELGRVVPPSSIEIVCYVPEWFISHVKQGEMQTFYLNGSLTELEGKVVRISPTRERYLIHTQLASVYGRDLPVITAQQTNNTVSIQKSLEMVESYYQITLAVSPKEVSDAFLKIGQTGKVAFKGHWRSQAAIALRSLQNAFWRESAF